MKRLTRRGTAPWALTGLAVLLLAAAFVRAAPDGTDADRRFAELTERLRRLEQAVGVGTGEKAQGTLDRRVTALEDGLRELSRAGGQAGWSSVSANLRDLQRVVRDATQRQEDLTRRVAALERGADAGSAERDLRDLRSRLDDLRRQVDDLRGRVARLETRR